jgi:gliding motility-associated-like protein
VTFQSSPNFTNVVAGTYTVTVRSTTGSVCTSTGSVVVKPAPGSVPVSATATDPTCTQGGTITVSAPVGADIEYSLDGVTFQSSPNFTNVVAGTYTVTVRSTTGSVCTSTGSVVVKPAPGAPVVTTQNKSICQGGSVQLTATPAGGVWTGNNVTNGVFSSVGLAPGVYTVTYTYSQNGCTSAGDATITVKANTTSITTITVCPNQLPYTWNGKQYTQAGTYTYITTNSSGCDSIASLVLEIAQVITGSTDNVTVCANSLPYTWNGQNIMQAGTYTSTLHNTAGCDSVITLNLVTTPLATATVSGGNPICAGTSTTLAIALTGSAPWTVVYSDGTTNHVINNIGASPYELTVSPTATTTYTLLSVTDAKCSNSAPNSAITITVETQQPGIRYPNVTTTANTATPLQARNLGSNYTYQWNPPVGLNRTDVIDPVFNYDNSVQYTITLTPDNGCRVVDTVLVIMREQGQLIRSDIFVPKAWSPNKDGHNDVLRPLCVNIKEIYYFRIFDRWGQLMYETNEIGKGWNGIFNNKAQVQDVYTWTLEALGEDGKHYKRSGNSILMR